MNTPLPKISAPAHRALATIRVECLEDLAEKTEKDILVLHGFGKNGMTILKKAMQDAGVEFAKGF